MIQHLQFGWTAAFDAIMAASSHNSLRDRQISRHKLLLHRCRKLIAYSRINRAHVKFESRFRRICQWPQRPNLEQRHCNSHSSNPEFGWRPYMESVSLWWLGTRCHKQCFESKWSAGLGCYNAYVSLLEPSEERRLRANCWLIQAHRICETSHPRRTCSVFSWTYGSESTFHHFGSF